MQPRRRQFNFCSALSSPSPDNDTIRLSIKSRWSCDGYLKTWTSPTDGHIKRRLESSQTVETSLKKKETALETQYSQVYERYLEKFSRVEQMQKQMQVTLALLDSLPTFGERK